jgi:xylan 1,4-beta-xylosidase
LATNGIDKPVLNVFRMYGLMGEEHIQVESSAAAALDAIMKGGVRTNADVGALAARADRTISVMVWNYHDDDLPSAPAQIDLTVAGVPAGVRRAEVRHYRIDENHSNSYTEWKAMGSPQQPTAEQYARLEAAGQLELLTSPTHAAVENGSIRMPFSLPRQGVSLVQVSW